MRSDDAVVLDADRDRLTVPEPVGRRVASGTCVVVVQPLDGIEPQLPSQVGELTIDATAESRFQRARDSTCESLTGEVATQDGIDGDWRWRGRRAGGALGVELRASA